MKNNENQPITKCKCNAGGLGISAFPHCSTTANPSQTDDGIKKENCSAPAWLRATLTVACSETPHYTCTNR